VRLSPQTLRHLIWFVPAKGGTDLKAVIVADGDARLPQRLAAEWLRGDADGPALIIAADGGAARAHALGLRPALVVGDMDSLPPGEVERLSEAGIAVEVFPPEKDESDTELAVRAALARGADTLVLIGALGGLRFDHALANLLLLELPELAGRDVALLDGLSSVRVIGDGGRMNIDLTGRRGDLVSLLPLTTTAEGITTHGLAYQLDDETLVQGPARGLSNEMRSKQCRVSLRSGRLAVIHTSVGEAIHA
jgi:thiamine pyrophosphokinase